MKRIFLMSLTAIVSGCAAPTVISSFNGDSVSIQSPQANGPDDAAAFSEARRICSAANRRAEYASSRQIYAPQYLSPTYEHLFICLDPATAHSPLTEAPYVAIGPAVAPVTAAILNPAPIAAQPLQQTAVSAMAPVPTQTEKLPGHRVAGYGCPGFDGRVIYAVSPDKLPRACEQVEPL